ncbi:type I secretion system permease/ATPase [uncultured Halomonas sp.]|uniref:type I secretion system permease/ATPase n=1 Tax=uncultured Halomonas sp. TaxID=173971 RepID=UPI00262CF5B1|nr:type I secretion system permease/ATPase [uncultured Halomonas sp.]
MTSSNSQEQDPLRHGLVALCHRLGKTVGVAELGDGLALEQGRLPLELVPRSLRRAGIASSVVNKPLGQLPERLLPALMLLRDGGSMVVVRRDGKSVTVALPETGGTRELPLQEVEALQDEAGTLILAAHRDHVDGRAEGFAVPREEHWLLGPVKRAWRAYTEVGVAAMMANLLAISVALFAMQTYDRVVPNAAFDTLWILASGVFIAVLFEFVLRTLRAHLLDVTGKRLDLQLSSLLFSRVAQMKLGARPGSTGAFSSQIREFDSVREFFTSSTAGAISDIPFVLLFLAIIAYVGGPVVWVPVAAIVLIVLPGILMQGTLARLSRQNLREAAVRNGVLLETIENLETVKATRAEGRHLRLWEGLSAQLAEAGVKSRSISAMLANGATLVQQLGYVGVVTVGVYQISAGNMTIGALIACTILTSRTIAPMGQVAGLLARWQHVKVAVEALDELMKAPLEREPGRKYVRCPRLRGHYRLEEVKVQYSEDAPPSLDIKALEIQAGERIALLGGNGAGKTTLLRLLSGLGTPSSGSLQVDGINLAQVDPSDRRRDIGYLPQDIALFYGTLRDNLTLDGEAHSDEELIEALEAVGLGNFVRRHARGLDMQLTGNRSVSGGQRQAIGLARLLLQDPAVVLMDEPTAAFDQNNEVRVIRYLQEWLKGRTVLISTHKKAVLALAERALVLKDGRLSMDGPCESIVSGNRVKTTPKASSGEARHG